MPPLSGSLPRPERVRPDECERLIEQVVNRYATYLAADVRDDLRQECRFALLRAVEKFDPARGTPFLAFARKVLSRAVKAYIRTEVRRGFSGLNTRKPTPPPKVISISATANDGGIPVEDTIEDRAAMPPRWDRARWEWVMGLLPDRQREVVSLRLFQNLTNREVGEQMGFRESRASHLWMKAIEVLRSNARGIDDP